METGWNEEINVYDDFLELVYDNYSVDSITEMLLSTGLLPNKSTQYIGSFEKYVFLHGNKDEIYSKQEINFISSIGEIIIFSDYFKKTKKNLFPCRIVAAKNEDYRTLDFCIALTKIVNKSTDGFNICVMVTKDGIVFSCRAYDGTNVNNYFISEFIRTEEDMDKISYNLLFSSDYQDFVEYYNYIVDCIRYRSDDEYYKPKLKNDRYLRELQYEYILKLRDYEKIMRVSFSGEINRCLHDLMDSEKKETYDDKVAEAEEFLFKIESKRINTMEMLFEAEERERMAIVTEQHNEEMIRQSIEDDESYFEDFDEDEMALLDDPEALIKLLKTKRGI